MMLARHCRVGCTHNGHVNCALFGYMRRWQVYLPNTAKGAHTDPSEESPGVEERRVVVGCANVEIAAEHHPAASHEHGVLS